MSKCLYEICIFFNMGPPPFLTMLKKNCRISKEVHPLSIQYSAQREGFFISCRVRYWILGSGSSSGWVGVMKCTIGYFGVSFLRSGISGIEYSWIFLGVTEYFRVFWCFSQTLMRRTGAQKMVFSKGAANY